jgi:hypothetical protein
MIWNSAFWPNTDLRDGDLFVVGEYIWRFDEAVARLFEGMVLLPLGHACRVEDTNYPGKAVPLCIEVTSPGVECLIDENLPEEPYHRWSRVELALQEGAYDFEFRGFFDWNQLGHREFQFVEVIIRRMDPKPDTIGHHCPHPCVGMLRMGGDKYSIVAARPSECGLIAALCLSHK